MFTQGDRCAPLADASGQHVVKFGHFKAFLAGNRNALRALAELGILSPLLAAGIRSVFESGSVSTLLNGLPEDMRPRNIYA